MGRTQIRTADIADGTILNEDIAANADIDVSKILVFSSSAATGTLYGTIEVGATGQINANAGIIRLPSAAAPVPTEGTIYWDGTNDIGFVYNGAAQDPLTQRFLPVNTNEFGIGSTVFTEVTSFRANLYKVFPLGVTLQGQVWIGSANASRTAEIRLWNVDDANVLISITGVTGTVPGVISESVSAIPPNAVKTYRLDLRVGGSGNPVGTAYIRGAILRR